MTDFGEDRLKGRGDDVYAALIEAHEGLSESESMALNASLILVLSNLVGDADKVVAAVAQTRTSFDLRRPGPRQQETPQQDPDDIKRSKA